MLESKIFNIFGVNKKAISRVYFYPVGSSLSLKSVCPSLDSLRPGSGSGPCRWSEHRRQRTRGQRRVGPGAEAGSCQCGEDSQRTGSGQWPEVSGAR